MDELVGKLLFFPRGNTFGEVTFVDTKRFFDNGDSHLMRWTDLATGEEHGANFYEEIGIEFFPVPDDFKREDAERYVEARKQRGAADEVLYVVEMKLTSWDGGTPE